MDASSRLAIAAHLHVLLRRHVGRVTDVEWMVSNRDYALTILAVARAANHPDLTTWALKLQDALQLPAFPAAAGGLEASPPPSAGGARDAPRYVRTLR